MVRTHALELAVIILCDHHLSVRGRAIHSKPHLSRKRLREVPTAPHHAQLQHITVLYRYRCVNSQILTPRSGELTAVRPFGRHVNAAPWHVSGDDHQRDTTGAPWPHQQLRHQELANGGEVLLKVRLASSKPPLSQWARSSKARAGVRDMLECCEQTSPLHTLCRRGWLRDVAQPAHTRKASIPSLA